MHRRFEVLNRQICFAQPGMRHNTSVIEVFTDVRSQSARHVKVGQSFGITIQTEIRSATAIEGIYV